MNDTMHASSAFLVYNLIYWIWFHTNPSGAACFFIIVMGIFPDFDGIFWTIKNHGKEMDMNFQHHLNSWFHWPIRWTFLIVFFIISVIFNFYPQYFLIPMLGVYLHLIGDSISCGDGMMWGHGWNKESYGRYINLWSNRTDGYHGKYWSARYKKTVFYKLEIVLGIIVLILSIWYMFRIGKVDIFNILIVLYVIGSISFTAKANLKEYEKEPTQGRYADYRKLESYLAWMEKHGYEFNSKMHIVKKNKKNKKNKNNKKDVKKEAIVA